jgi:hypothetical protein
MELRAELAALKNGAITAIEQAAKERDTTRIRILSDLLAEIEGDERAAAALEDRIRSHEERLKSPDEAPMVSQPIKLTEVTSRKARGKAMREEFVRRCRRGLTPEKGVIYRTRSGSRVGIAAATELPNEPKAWWLGLPDTQLDCVVLLCHTDKEVLDFVLPMTSLSHVWSRLSRSRSGVKFNVNRRNGTYQLQVPGASPLDIGPFLGQYAALG